jgi:hypothetical protein
MDPLEPQSTMTTPDHMLILLLFPGEDSSVGVAGWVLAT